MGKKTNKQHKQSSFSSVHQGQADIYCCLVEMLVNAAGDKPTVQKVRHGPALLCLPCANAVILTNADVVIVESCSSSSQDRLIVIAARYK